MKVKFIAKWYDFWVGWYWDSKIKHLYVLPIPCLGVVFDFRKDYSNVVADSDCLGGQEAPVIKPHGYVPVGSRYDTTCRICGLPKSEYHKF